MYLSKKQTKNGITKLVVLCLVLSMSIPLLAFPIVNAQTVNKYTSYIFVASGADVVGIGQLVSLVTWTTDIPPDIGETTGAVQAPSGRAGWYNMQIKLQSLTTQHKLLPYPIATQLAAAT